MSTMSRTFMTDDNNITNNDTATTSSANDYDENGFEWYNNLSQELSPTQQVIIVIGIILSSILSASSDGQMSARFKDGAATNYQ